MYFAQYKGVYFVEGSPTNARRLGPISTEINSLLGSNQSKSLDDVKEQMIQTVLAAGGNAVIDFKYGQRSTFWKSLIGRDNVYWYASGEIAQVDPASLT